MEKFWEGKYEREESLNVCYVVYESQFKRLVQHFGKQSEATEGSLLALHSMNTGNEKLLVKR